jgi:hypothetical protein
MGLIKDPETGELRLTADPPKNKPQDNFKPPTPRKGDRVALVIQRRGEYVRFVRDCNAAAKRG